MTAEGRQPVAGRVSVVVVNFRGAPDTIVCLQELTKLDFPSERLEIICVDNASGDDSLSRLAAAAPDCVLLVESPRNSGFTGGCNRGVKHATGEFIAFINNDARPDRRWLAEATDVLAADASIGCIASKVLDWHGSGIDFVDAALTWFGMGYKPGAGTPDEGAHDVPKDVLFATGSAMVIRASVFATAGGFDERYFMFYEDVDLGWRLNLMGQRVRYVPSSLVYHKHHASMQKFGEHNEWFLLERNALMTLYKNVSEEALGRLLAPAMALSVRRSLAVGQADPTILDMAQGFGGDGSETVNVNLRSLTGAYAIDSFIDHLPSLVASRTTIQRTRIRSDRALRPLMREVIEPAIPNPRYLEGHQVLIDAFGIQESFASGWRILVITGDPLSTKMAGPAIRAFHIADALSDEHDVRLVSTTSCSLQTDRFASVARNVAESRREVAWADIVIIQGFVLSQAPWLGRTNKILVPDLYDPINLEQLEQTRGNEVERRRRDILSTTDALNLQLRRGDFFLCANENQRHFWLGQLAAVGRLNPETYDRDPTLQSLLAVVPFGLPDAPPQQSRPAIKGGEYGGISESDKVILWAGGIYDWFDPMTLVHAVARLSEHRPTVRLFFLGLKHPNSSVPTTPKIAEIRDRSDALGLTEKFVFFNEGWVDYEERQDYLLDADVGVSTHVQHIEATFSSRTRILDYLWAGLPIVATAGDTFGNLITSQQLGVAVPERDVDALVEALERCLYDEDFAAECRTNVARVADDFTWQVVLEPLLAFCRAPQRASDVGTLLRAPLTPHVRNGTTNLALARHYLRQGGAIEVLRRSGGRIRRVVSDRRRRGSGP